MHMRDVPLVSSGQLNGLRTKQAVFEEAERKRQAQLRDEAFTRHQTLALAMLESFIEAATDQPLTAEGLPAKQGSGC